MHASNKGSVSGLILAGVVLAIVLSGGAHAEPAGMYVSVRDAFIHDNTFATPVEGLRQLGINTIELNLTRDFEVCALDTDDNIVLKTDEDVKAYRTKVEKLGVRICAILTACDFSQNDRESNIGWIARAIEIADMLGVPAVRIDSAMKEEKKLDFETRVNLFVDGLSGALQKTAHSKVTLGIENHGFQGNNVTYLLNVFQQVGSDRLGCTLDTGNFYWRGYPLSEVYGILRVLAPHAKHTHVKNIHYPEDKREITREAGWEYGKYMCPLDEGDIDIAKVVGILAKAGYTGDVCIEDESLSKCKTKEERVAILIRDIECVKKAIAAQGK